MPNQTYKIKIAIADDHVLFAKGVANLINSVKDMQVVLIANNGLELLKGIEQVGQPDVVLMDIEMPVMDGYQTTAELLKVYPSCKIIALSMHKEESFISQMILSGVCGYLLKNAQPEDVISAIKSVVDGGLAFNNDAISVMKCLIVNNLKPSLTRADFSERELQILELVCQEKTNQEIGNCMLISKSLVESYKQKMIKKMQVKNSVGMAIYAVQYNLLVN
jgi:DNA-binding NarL/FixJ family response regulator